MAARPTDSTNTTCWLGGAWAVTPVNYRFLPVFDPPQADSLLETFVVEPGSDDAEDLQDAMAGELAYRLRGIQGLRRYSDYQARRGGA